MNAAALTAVLADKQGPASEAVTPGVLGFITVALIGLALYFLMKNMRKQMRSISFDEDATDRSGAADVSAAAPNGERGA